jgi:hypothetical protein
MLLTNKVNKYFRSMRIFFNHTYCSISGMAARFAADWTEKSTKEIFLCYGKSYNIILRCKQF